MDVVEYKNRIREAVMQTDTDSAIEILIDKVAELELYVENLTEIISHYKILLDSKMSGNDIVKDVYESFKDKSPVVSA